MKNLRKSQVAIFLTCFCMLTVSVSVTPTLANSFPILNTLGVRVVDSIIAPNSGCIVAPLPNFPPQISVSQETFHNWAEDIVVHDLWTSFPKSVAEIIEIINWAAKHGYQVRASGFMHNWSPLTVSSETDSCANSKILLIKTTMLLTRMKMVNYSHSASDRDLESENNEDFDDIVAVTAVKVQTGASMENLLTFLEANGFGFFAVPTPGDISVGGVIATGGHGTGTFRDISGESADHPHPHGFTAGTLNNLIVRFTAIVWDDDRQKYVSRQFDRAEPDSKAFLTNLGRTFLIDVTLQVGRNYNLRCVSRVDIPAAELFAPVAGSSSYPGPGPGRTMEKFLESSGGRISTLWFPFTANPWLKIWTVSPVKPPNSRQVTTPYNYPFSDNVPLPVALLAGQLVEGAAWQLTPELGAVEFAATSAGLAATASNDIWGPSKNSLLYVKKTTLRVTACGFAVITARPHVQIVIHEVTSVYQNLMQEYAARNEYPINGPLEIRITGLDWPEDVQISTGRAEPPMLSPIKPIKGRPDLNTAVWFDILTFPGTPTANSFLRDLEFYFLYVLNDGVRAVVRIEWSKGWAYTKEGPHTNETVIKDKIRDLFGRSAFEWTVKTLDDYDPFQVFSNNFLDQVLV